MQIDALLELVTDDETDMENVDDTVDNEVSVPDVVWDAECELQGDAV